MNNSTFWLLIIHLMRKRQTARASQHQNGRIKNTYAFYCAKCIERPRPLRLSHHHRHHLCEYITSLYMIRVRTADVLKAMIYEFMISLIKIFFYCICQRKLARNLRTLLFRFVANWSVSSMYYNVLLCIPITIRRWKWIIFSVSIESINCWVINTLYTGAQVDVTFRYVLAVHMWTSHDSH